MGDLHPQDTMQQGHSLWDVVWGTMKRRFQHNTAQAGQVSALMTLWDMRSSDIPWIWSSGITGSSLVGHGGRGEQGMFALRWPQTVGVWHPISQKQSVNWSITVSLQENLGAALIAADTASPTASRTVRHPLFPSASQDSSFSPWDKNNPFASAPSL